MSEHAPQHQADSQGLDGTIPSTSRIEAFSDGVIAIALTVLVLELHVPDLVSTLTDQQVGHLLLGVLPKLAAYLLSFLLIAIYWVNHHHLFHLLERADAGLLWANNNLLLWLSLLSFPTALMGEHSASSVIAAVYGGVSMLAALAFLILHRYAYRARLFSATYSEKAYRSDARANQMTLVMYVIFISLAWWHPLVSEAGYALIALMYFMPRVRAR